MTLATWSDQYLTGLPEIDDQHRRLFEAINRLDQAFRTGDPEQEARQSLAFLIQYTVEHFEQEEAYMQAIGYPLLDFHKKEHSGLVTQLLGLRLKLDTSADPLLHATDFAAHMANFTADWLAHHINEADMGYVQFGREQGRPFP